VFKVEKMVKIAHFDFSALDFRSKKCKKYKNIVVGLIEYFVLVANLKNRKIFVNIPGVWCILTAILILRYRSNICFS